jgi:lysine N6-hydroxylase
MSRSHDVVAIGIGPFNLGLACLVDPIAEIDAVFLDRKDSFDWHPGMLLEDSTLQVPFMADLVTLADPTSRFSYLSYLKRSGRLYPFYIRESFYPLRTEYNAYCRWAAGQLDSLRFGRDVQAVEYDERDQTYAVHAIVTSTGERETYRGRTLVLGTGTPPYVPEPCRDLPGDAVHSADYLDAKPNLQAKQSITIVGSGQSAAEIYYDLLGDIDRHGYDLTWVTRSPRFFPLEYTKLTLEMTSPDYVDYFHGLPAATRDRLVPHHKGLYKGIDSSLIDAIYDLLYRKSLHGRCPTTLHTNTAVRDAWFDDETKSYVLDLCQVEQQRSFAVSTEGVVFATGYRYEVPDFLAPITDRIAWDTEGRFDVTRDYCIDAHGSTIYVQNAELHTHGFGAPDLGLAAYRNSCIVRALLGREHYPIERSIAFQDFAAPTELSATTRPGARIVADNSEVVGP